MSLPHCSYAAILIFTIVAAGRITLPRQYKEVR